ncbi:MAG: threonylcarbamoyl-AMP synthase [Deltaproteobacteria bacterium]|nr:threonylcarbamoyl-AMP synthase [Deltaproteobacteria bacterium]
MARIAEPSYENLHAAAQLLRKGEVVGMPTETVYGLAGSVFDESALARIFAVKERPTFDPLIVHLGSEVLMSEPLVALAKLELVRLDALNELARGRTGALMRAFWPGPLTVVLPKTSRVPDLATSGLPTVGLRVPRHPVAQALIAAAGVPLAAPSANRFGRISPTTARHVDTELGDRIPLILDGGSCAIGLESTVVTVLEDGHVILLRPGAITRESLEQVTGTPMDVAGKPYAHTLGLSAPGMLESHYAPARRLVLLPTSVSQLDAQTALRLAQDAGPKIGLLLQAGNAGELGRKFGQLTGREVVALSLSREGDVAQAARNLFSSLRSLDESGATLLFAEPCVGQTGLAHAIADRLNRAAAKT